MLLILSAISNVYVILHYPQNQAYHMTSQLPEYNHAHLRLMKHDNSTLLPEVFNDTRATIKEV